MFSLGFIIGIYSYLILFLGLVGKLNGVYTFIVTCLYIIFLFITKKFFITISPQRKSNISRPALSLIEKVGVVIILALLAIALVGMLAPELAFDALWYHLTLPKLYKLSEAVVFIPGGLLYYSAMPKLTEMLYTAALFTPLDFLPKMIHYFFGLATGLSIYFITKDELGRKAGILAVVLFLSNIVVSWELTTAYIDLARTFFETVALWGLILWFKTKKTQWLLESALMLGLAVSTKLLAFSSLPLFVGMIFLMQHQVPLKETIRKLFYYVSLVLLVPLPWLMFSYSHTGNPVYPFFTSLYPVSPESNFFHYLPDIFQLFVKSADPLSPLYLILLPVGFIFYKKLPTLGKFLFIFSIGSLFIWLITPRSGGGRFFLPFLPAWTILSMYIIEQVKQQKIIYNVAIGTLIFLACITIGYRGVATVKYIPVVLGLETKDLFLKRHLNFAYGDFYDVDGYFKKSSNESDTVLLYGFHNLYYVEFPFIHESWAKTGDTFTHIAVQGDAKIPQRFSGLRLLYENTQTHVKLYSVGEGRVIY